MRRRTRSTVPQNRLGFTLIELLVVIVILGLLIGLLVPAVMNAIGSAKDAACAAEIRAMGQALADFKSKYNCYPPSRVLISEGGDYSTVTIPPTSVAGKLVPRSTSYLRRIWPRLQFNTSGAAGSAPGIDTATAGKFYDVNGNNSYDGTPYVLDGTQCLVFFLGGIPQPNGSGWSMTGFSKNPTNPFQTTGITTNRTVPLFEFNNSRLTGANFPGYVDSFGSSSEPNVIPYYCYFSAYEGAGYDPDDVNGNEPDSTGSISPINGAFTAPAAATPSVYSGSIVRSPAPNPYTNDTPVNTVAGTGAVGTGAKSPAWQNGQSFQIISSGRDRLFGIGGQYLANGTDRLPFVLAATGYAANSFQTQQANATVTGQTLSSDTRYREKDNVTNFSSGKLD